MILFLFVLMLVGRDASDSLIETLRGQRWAAALFGVGFALLVAISVGRAFRGSKPVNLNSDQPNSERAERQQHRRNCCSASTCSPSSSPPHC